MANQKHPAIEELDFKELALSILRKWYIFVIIGIFAFIGAIYSILSTAPLYSTEGTIIIQQKDDALSVAMKQFSLASFLFNSNKKVDDETIILRSKNISQQMVETLDLQVNSFYKKRLGTEIELYKNEPVEVIYPENFKKKTKGSFTIEIAKKNNNKWIFHFTQKLGYKKIKQKHVLTDLSTPINTQWGEFSFIEHPEFIDNDYPDYNLKYRILPLKNSVEQYNTLLNISLSNKKANAINISIIGGNIVKNETIVNTIIDLYQQFNFEQKLNSTIKLESFISERINIINNDLQIIEKKIEEFRVNNNLADLTLQAESALESSREYNKLLTEVDMEFTVMSFIEKFLRESDELELIPTNTGIIDEVLSNLIITHNNDVIEYLRLTRSSSENSPDISQLKDKITLSRKNILQTITNMKEGAALRREDIVRKNEEIDQQINNVPSIEREYIAITREQEIKHELYLFLLQKKEETQFAMSSTDANEMIVDRAYTFESAVAPDSKFTLLVAIIITLVLGLCYVYIESLFDSNILNKKQIRKLTNAPLIGTIPNIDHIESAEIVGNPKYENITDAFRSIRTNILLANKLSSDNKTLLITSTNNNEGKTLTALNLALSFASLRKKTILIGLDLRQSSLSEYLNLHNSMGMSEFLNDDCNIQNFIHTHPNNQYLNVITSGAIPQNPSELLNLDKLNSLFTELRKQYDYIIIDSAPINLISDTLLLDNYADNILFVCKKDYTKISQIKKLNNLIEDKLLNNVSIIFNKIKKSNFA
jgi:capsular exopolysaccharide synthesis family protein